MSADDNKRALADGGIVEGTGDVIPGLLDNGYILPKSTIDRYAFFDALRGFFPTKDAHETRIYPDRIEVHRFVRGEDGRVLHEGHALLHTVETYLLTGQPPAATPK